MSWWNWVKLLFGGKKSSDDDLARICVLMDKDGELGVNYHLHGDTDEIIQQFARLVVYLLAGIYTDDIYENIMESIEEEHPSVRARMDRAFRKAEMEAVGHISNSTGVSEEDLRNLVSGLQQAEEGHTDLPDAIVDIEQLLKGQRDGKRNNSGDDDDKPFIGSDELF